MAFSGPIEDQMAIRALHENYADAVFRRDASAWGALWADDARWDFMGMIMDGREAIVATWNGAMSGFSFAGFFVQPGAIEVDGDSATGRVYTNEVLEDLDGNLRRIVGQYEDQYVRQNGNWAYQARKFVILKE
jgi:uncharacterized protein (TIGR02246 family)